MKTSLASPAMAPENLLMRLCRALRWKPQEGGVKQQAASLPSVETEVIESKGGRKRHTGVARKTETYTTKTQDFATTNQ